MIQPVSLNELLQVPHCCVMMDQALNDSLHLSSLDLRCYPLAFEAAFLLNRILIRSS